MNARDRMLSRIRAALADVAASAGYRPPQRKTPSGGDPAQFAAALTALGGRCFEAAGVAAARSLLAELTAGRKVIGSQAPIVAACGFATPFSRELCAQAETGITSADFALADTGSLVFFSESGESRLISLLPPHHIAVIERDKIISGLDELAAHMPGQSSSMVIVTGPSRTADIEMRLVRGVHGPGELTVIVVTNVTAMLSNASGGT